MTSRITSFIAPVIPVQIPVAYSPTDELLMLIGAATSGGAVPSGPHHVYIAEGSEDKVRVGSSGDLVVYV
jgi:hypothetical protein